MYLIREVFHCKPGKVRKLVEKFLAMSKLNEQMGMAKMRIMTDFSGAPYWTLVAEFEVESMKAFEDMMQGMGDMDAATTKKFEEIMEGYHDLIDRGGREIYKIEA
jgi:hypothetical protein